MKRDDIDVPDSMHIYNKFSCIHYQILLRASMTFASEAASMLICLGNRFHALLHGGEAACFAAKLQVNDAASM